MKTNSRFFTIGLVNSLVLIQHWCLVEQIFTKQLRLQIHNLLDQTACLLLSYTAIAWLKMVSMQVIRSRVQFLKISALSLVFCVSVVLENISLRFLPVSFNQVSVLQRFLHSDFRLLMMLKREA
ncbi:hypothetical protein V6N13_027732 [Hibiscus sabdariffa]